MKNIDIEDIVVSSKLDNIVKTSVNEGYNERLKKNILNKKHKRNIVAATIIVSLITTILAASFNNEVTAAVKLAMFDIRNYLGINTNLDEYTTIVNKSVSKNGLTIQLNEVILDKDEVIVSTTVKSDKKLSSNASILTFGSVYINGKKISSGAGGSSKQIDDYTEERVLSYTLDKELEYGDLYIEIKYDEAILYTDNKENTIKGPWTFKFVSNDDSLSANTNSIKLNNSFESENGQKINLTEYRSNDIGQKIYYSIENKDKNNVYVLELRGYDDLGNEVTFYSTYENINNGLFKNQTEISEDAKTLKLTPYAVAFANESGKMSNDYKQISEEFIIQIK